MPKMALIAGIADQHERASPPCPFRNYSNSKPVESLRRFFGLSHLRSKECV